MFLLATLFNFLLGVDGQQSSSAGRAEVHPTLMTQKCTSSGCTSQTSKVVIDANWRWLHSVNGYQNCFTDPNWDPNLCPNPQACASNCALDGANYLNDYGVSASGSTLTLQMYPPNNPGNTGSRVYLMSDDSHYAKIPLANQEVSFDVDTSKMPCGTNGALYFVDMDADGGSGRYPTNKAGAGMGTGYCDAQCPKDVKFINGTANLLNWSQASRTGRYGSCCAEIDIWEANNAANAFTLHPCSQVAQTSCDGTTSACNSICDSPGCDFNPYRNGDKTFYGQGKTIDPTTGPIRVITQFITDTGTSDGTIKEVKRFYIKRGTNGQLIQNAPSRISGVAGNSLNDAYCTAEKSAFNEPNPFPQYGGFSKITEAAKQGMVLTMSAFVDYAVGMLWLDSTYPPNGNPNQPGVVRGPCSTSSGDPNTIKNNNRDAQVTFSNIRWGDIGTTYKSAF